MKSLDCKTGKNQVTAKSRNSQLSWLALFVLIALILVTTNIVAIKSITYEMGDPAANSLLVEKAKSLRLLVGNYSRLGFNHPGPAILYVLAFGEMLFYDVLGLVRSPYSGQLIAVDLYNAFWIVSIIRLINRYTRSYSSTVLAGSVFLFSTALFDYHFFNGNWFPYLYYFPFAVMLFSVSRLADGNTDSLHSLALSSGFLINGHVSFVPILATIFLVTVVYNYYTYRTLDNTKCLIDRSFLILHRRSIFTFLGILFLFIIPLLIKTIIDFPGPIADYMAYTGGHPSNSLYQALVFASYYWGGPGLLFIEIGAVLVFRSYFRKCQYQSNNIRSLMAAIIAATIALIIYAVFGIDLLSHKYIALFYYSAPAIAASTVFICIYNQSAVRYKKPIALLLSAFVLLAAYIAIYRWQDGASDYSRPNVPDLYQQLAEVKTNGRLVFDLDAANSNDWEYVWTHVVGLELYSRRRSNDLFCIDRHWHILFTEAARCNPAEIHNDLTFIVSKTGHNGNPAISPYVEGLGLSFYKMPSPGNFDLPTKHSRK
jgi:hypothetical protein